MHIDLPSNVEFIIDRLMEEGFDAYAVGGCVRDSILGRKPDDWDITTSARPMKIKELFDHTVDTGLIHGTITVIVGGEGYEVTTYRIDGEYEDNRHPKEVIFTDNLIEDLKRRDFTINAMAYNKVRGLVDEYDGRGDIERKLIRCVGEPAERFDEDALRVMRAVRFAGQLGFDIDEATMSAMKEKAPNLADISAERIQVELMKLLVSPNPGMLLTAYECKITGVVLPEFDRMMETQQNNPHHIYNVGMHTVEAVCAIRPDRVLRLTMLLHDVAKPDTMVTTDDGHNYFKNHAEAGEEKANKIIRRLKMDNDTRNKVKRLIRYHDYRFYDAENVKEESEIERSIRHAVSLIGDDIFEDLLQVMEADVRAQSSYFQKEKLEQLDVIREVYRKIKEKKQCLSVGGLAVNGSDLIEIGIPKGKQIGDTLNKLLDYVLDNPEDNTREKLLELASGV